MTGPGMQMVDNPIHQRLQALKKDAEGAAEAIGNALDVPCNAMASGQVWVGPSARAWEDELGDHRRALRQVEDAMMATIEEELATQPAEVPAAMTRMPAWPG